MVCPTATTTTTPLGDHALCISSHLHYLLAELCWKSLMTPQIILRLQQIEVFEYLNWFTAASVRALFDYNLSDRTRNNGAKLIVNHFNTSVAQHFYPIKTTTTCNAQPNKVVSSRTVNSFKNGLDKHWVENSPNVLVNCIAIIDAVHNSSVHKQS